MRRTAKNKLKSAASDDCTKTQQRPIHQRINTRRGFSAFDQHYQRIYQERWSKLLQALQKPKEHFHRFNQFYFLKQSESMQHQAHSAPISVRLDYAMDLASIFPAMALDVQASQQVLDMCAAPGGKSLILAESLFCQDTGHATLTCNEFSNVRRARLHRVIREYVPENYIKNNNIKITGYDAQKWCLYQTEVFDRILVDAPCSGERHLLETPSELENWTEKRSKNLAIRQYTLLASALELLKPNGRMVYSTCSISPYENDDVIRKLLKKRADRIHLIKEMPHTEQHGQNFYNFHSISEKTEFGFQIFPDQSNSIWGPIYFAIIDKIR